MQALADLSSVSATPPLKRTTKTSGGVAEPVMVVEDQHGGAPGSGAPVGNLNALRHGFYTAEAITERRLLKLLLRRGRAMIERLER